MTVIRLAPPMHHVTPRLGSATAWTMPRAGSVTSAEMGLMGLSQTAYRAIAMDLPIPVILQQGNVWIAKADGQGRIVKSKYCFFRSNFGIRDRKHVGQGDMPCRIVALSMTSST